jgi:hypothetical protein
MLVSANLYPWDVDGDPAAADRIAGLGLSQVTLAAAYHAVRAVTPFHPEHRIVTRDASVYYRADTTGWGDSPLRPAKADPPGSEADPAGSFERAAGRLRAAGLRVSAWAVLSHNARLGTAVPSSCVHNAYGDCYPWALCIASPASRAYLAALAAEVASLSDADEIELEACGWYGIDHASAHDKTPGSGAGTAAEWLLSLCFCPSCGEAYAQAGADPAELRSMVRRALDETLRWGPESARPTEQQPGADLLPGSAGLLPGSAGLLPGGADLLPGEAVSILLRVRTQLAERLLREVIAAVRGAAPGKPVLVHSDPDPRATGANPGYHPAVLLGQGGADGIVLACWNPASAGPLAARTAAAAPAGARIAASLLAVAGLGGNPETLAEQADAVRRAGATELRLYHAGLASASDLAAIRSLCRTHLVASFSADPWSH